MLTYGMDKFVVWGEFCWDMRYEKYYGTMKPVYVVVADDLKDNQVRVSENYVIPSTGYGLVPSDLKMAFSGQQGVLHIEKEESGNDTAGAQADEIDQNMKAAGLETDSEETSQKANRISIDIEYAEDFSQQGGDFIEVSPEIYQKLRDYYNIGTTQASVYIANYSKTDKVLRELQDMGYDAISTYQVSATKYVQEKVYKRLEVIGISTLILIALAILQILIIRSILKIKKKDYSVLRFIGMRRRQMGRITYLEMGIHCIAAVIVTAIIMVILQQTGVSFIRNMMFYYGIIGFVLFIVYNAVLLFLTVFFFNRTLRQE